MTENDERIKKNYDKYYEVLKAHKNDPIKLIKMPESSSDAEKAVSQIKELFNNPISAGDMMKL